MEVMPRVFIMEYMAGKKHKTEITLPQLLGKRIKELRQQKGFTQEDLAEVCGVHPSLIGPIESGKKFPRAETLNKLAKALEVPIYQLWMVEPEVKPKQRAIQELVDLLNRCPEKDAEFLLYIGKELIKRYH